jgi:hypothetical protein
MENSSHLSDFGIDYSKKTAALQTIIAQEARSWDNCLLALA